MPTRFLLFKLAYIKHCQRETIAQTPPLLVKQQKKKTLSKVQDFSTS